MRKAIEINILYAAKDDEDIIEGRGWVSYFEKFLRMMLQQTSSDAFEVKLIPDTSAEIVISDGIVIAILSPDFILSGICLDQLENFSAQHGENLDKAVFKVFKTAIDYVDVPAVIKGIPAYNMFYTDEDNAGRVFNDFFSKEAEPNYWMKMIDLCFDIYESIIEQVDQSKSSINEKHKRKAIYLAETGQDLTGARNIIKRELSRHGFELYPKSNRVQTLTEWKSSIEQELALCTFSIHLVGASYGTLPKGAEISVMDLQNEMAASYAEEHPDFSRLIWITPALKYASEKQKSFIHNIKRDAHASAGAEVLQTSLEDFKNTLWEEILEGGISRKLRKPSIKDISKKVKVYLIYDAVDSKKAESIKERLNAQDCEILEMPQKGELMELRNQHVDFLKQMDAAIVVQDKVNEQWVHMKLLDLLKAPGFGRSQAILGRLMLSTSEDKNRQVFENKYVVKSAALSDHKAIDKFTQEVRKAFDARYQTIDAKER